MGWRGAAAEAAAAEAAKAAAESTASAIPPNICQGVGVTVAFFVLMYLFFFAQGTMKRKLRAYYSAQGKKQFDRYFSRDRKMLGWDRTVGNMLEQSIPFLSLFWLNIFLSPFGGISSGYITVLGWAYVSLRSIYPILWFAGGGGPAGSQPLIWRVTFPMYAIIATFAANAVVTVSGGP